MIELTFGEGPAGALKVAKSMKRQGRAASAIGIIGATRREARKLIGSARREARRLAAAAYPALEGGADDVESLELALDIGDIAGLDGDLDARRKVLESLYGDFPGVPDALLRASLRALARIRGATHEKIRLWVCMCDPAELCGLYFVCRLLPESSAPLYVVRVPHQLEAGQSMISHRSTGEIPPEGFASLALREEEISPLLRKHWASLWDGLARENAPLRAAVNGAVMGVPENFYDFALRANLPQDEESVARIIGKTLLALPGVGDRWLFARIQSMLRAGELIQVRPPSGDHPYSGTVRRSRHAT